MHNKSMDVRSYKHAIALSREHLSAAAIIQKQEEATPSNKFTF